MKLCNFLSALILLQLLDISSYGQKPEIPPPTAPFVAAPPDRGTWVIKLENSSSTAQERPNLLSGDPIVKVEVSKTGLIKRDTIFYSSGRSEEVWFYANAYFIRYSNSEKIAVMDSKALNAGPENRIGDLLLSSAFPALSWVDIKYYAGIEKINDRPAYHYILPKSPPVTMLGNDGKPITVQADDEAQAWIDVETRLPRAFKYSGTTYTYTFSSPPSSELSLPPKQAEAMERTKRLLSE